MTNKPDRNKRFIELLESNKGIIYKVARTYCVDEEDRQDLVQEISIQIWRSLDKYNAKYKASTWMYRIALNVAISFYRKHTQRKVNTLPLGEQIFQDNEIDGKEKEQQLILLDQFISELNDFDKALMLLYLEDKSHLEIAEILGLSVSNVGTKIGRIKEIIKIRFSKIKAY